MFSKLSFIFRLPIAIAGFFIPKNEKIWVFGSWFGNKIADNSKYFYLFIHENKDVRAIWIYKNKNLSNYLKCRGLEGYYYKSIKGVFYQLIASKAFVSHSISSDLNPLAISINTQRIQLWHGVPLKKIMYDNPLENMWYNRSKLYRVITNNYYNYILSPNVYFDKIFSSAFDIPEEYVISCGYPRNDAFFSHCKEKNQVFKAIYMPTYRNNDKNKNIIFSEKYKFDFSKIDCFLALNSIELTIRVHPANLPPEGLMEALKKSTSIKLSLVDDVYEEINNYDCLITDYSSILFDFSLTKKPIIFSSFDLNNFLSEERGLYYSYSDISGGYEANDWDEVLNKLIESKCNPKDSFYGPLLKKINNQAYSGSGENKCFCEKLYDELCAK